jgi:hypothetical protein
MKRKKGNKEEENILYKNTDLFLHHLMQMYTQKTQKEISFYMKRIIFLHTFRATHSKA